jgi:hypothetical protein
VIHRAMSAESYTDAFGHQYDDMERETDNIVWACQNTHKASLLWLMQEAILRTDWHRTFGFPHK